LGTAPTDVEIKAYSALSSLSLQALRSADTSDPDSCSKALDHYFQTVYDRVETPTATSNTPTHPVQVIVLSSTGRLHSSAKSFLDHWKPYLRPTTLSFMIRRISFNLLKRTSAGICLNPVP
jgi:hypothetical protein